MASNKIYVTLKSSVIATPKRHKKTILGLGLKRQNQTAELKNTSAIQGMVHRVSYLIQVSDQAPQASLPFGKTQEYQIKE